MPIVRPLVHSRRIAIKNTSISKNDIDIINLERRIACEVQKNCNNHNASVARIVTRTMK